MVCRRRRSRLDNPIRQYCFSNIFNNLNAEQLGAIRSLYTQYGGMLPSRRILAEAARRIGVTQARIRKWFEEEKGHHTESSSPESMRTLGSEPECCSRKLHGDELLLLTRQLEEINERLEHVKSILQKACNKIHQISMALATL